ncbi:hypothetical protein SCOR_26435 [Sulfidibacter corallicola]
MAEPFLVGARPDERFSVPHEFFGETGKRDGIFGFSWVPHRASPSESRMPPGIRAENVSQSMACKELIDIQSGTA